MNPTIHRKLAQRKRRLERRLDKSKLPRGQRPMFTASNIHYEISERTRGLAHGGIGVIHALALNQAKPPMVDGKIS